MDFLGREDVSADKLLKRDPKAVIPDSRARGDDLARKRPRRLWNRAPGAGRLLPPSHCLQRGNYTPPRFLRGRLSTRDFPASAHGGVTRAFKRFAYDGAARHAPFGNSGVFLRSALGEGGCARPPLPMFSDPYFDPEWEKGYGDNGAERAKAEMIWSGNECKWPQMPRFESRPHLITGRS